MRWNPPALTGNEANRQRMDAAARHRPQNARSRTQSSQAAAEIHASSSLPREYNCVVWPFMVRHALAINTELLNEIYLA